MTGYRNRSETFFAQISVMVNVKYGSFTLAYTDTNTDTETDTEKMCTEQMGICISLSLGPV